MTTNGSPETAPMTLEEYEKGLADFAGRLVARANGKLQEMGAATVSLKDAIAFAALMLKVHEIRTIGEEETDGSN